MYTNVVYWNLTEIKNLCEIYTEIQKSLQRTKEIYWNHEILDETMKSLGNQEIQLEITKSFWNLEISKSRTLKTPVANPSLQGSSSSRKKTVYPYRFN